MVGNREEVFVFVVDRQASSLSPGMLVTLWPSIQTSQTAARFFESGSYESVKRMWQKQCRQQLNLLPSLQIIERSVAPEFGQTDSIQILPSTGNYFRFYGKFI